MSIRYIKFSKEFTPVDLYEKYKALPETVSAKESDGYEVIFVDARDVGQLPPPEVGGLHPNKTQRGQVPILVR